MFFWLVIIFVVAAYYYCTRSFNYWHDRNVPHNKPIPFFGNNLPNYLSLQTWTQMADSLYRKFPDARFVGFYRGTIPELIVKDPDLIRHVMASDFNHFYRRGLGRNPDVEPLLLNLFNADGDDWKLLRQRLTPAFTSGKLRAMFPLIVECTETLEQLAEQKIGRGPVDMREMLARFTTDFIGACGFGIKMDSMNDAVSHFRVLGQEIFTFKPMVALRYSLKEMFPKLFHNMKVYEQFLEDGMYDMVKAVVEQRNYKPSGRNDFIDLMLELRAQGAIVADSMTEVDANGLPKKVTREMNLMMMTAQAFIFFTAGFETSSSSSSFTLHQLARNPHIQKICQDEIDRVLAKYNGKICYEAVKEMSYLERTFYEGIRMFPSLGVLHRTCAKNFKVPESDLVIEKGMKIIIPVNALHNDEKHFKKPEVFDPDRFLPEAVRERHKYVYLPFGEGPRQCVGMRLGLMQSMTGLVVLLRKFSFSLDPAHRDLQVDPTCSIVQNVKNGVPLIIRRRA